MLIDVTYNIVRVMYNPTADTMLIDVTYNIVRVMYNPISGVWFDVGVDLSVVVVVMVEPDVRVNLD